MKRPRLPVAVSLNFMPGFYHKHLGLDYGEDYYFEPGYRAEVERAEGRFLYEALGRFGVGSPRPEPSASLFIQPIDLIKLTQGAQLVCPPAATLEARGQPWAGLSLAQIARIDAAGAARHPIIDRIVGQYRELGRLYGARADIFGIRSGLMNVHAPLTTAHQLCGEGLFLLMMDESEGARTIFAKVWDIYLAVFDRLSRELGAAFPDRLQLGDCSASLLSPELYRSAVLPFNSALATSFAQTGYHSCGPSTHLLSSFAEIPGLSSIELGSGTDLDLAVRCLPPMEMRPLVDPLLMLGGSEEEVGVAVARMLESTAGAPSTTLCAWSFDAETPLCNVEALYRSVEAS